MVESGLDAISTEWHDDLPLIDLGSAVSISTIEACALLSYRVEHDIGNIAVAVLGNADRISNSGRADTDIKNRTDKIKDAMNRGLDMTARLGTFRSALRTMNESADLDSLVKGAAARCAMKFRIRLEIRTPVTSVKIPVDGSMKMIAAVSEMIENAADAMIDSESGSITVSSGAVALDADDISKMLHEYPMNPGEYAFVCVKDSGTGIHEDVIPKMFFPAFSSKMRRLGFGLSDAYGIVCRLYCGGIGLWTRKDRGSAFGIFIPKSV